MKNFKGIFPALLTPFDGNGKINDEELIRLVEYNIEKGVDGFYAGGSTAEAFLLSFEERKQILKTIAEAANGRCTLIAQTGCIGTDLTIELARCCESLGYDAVSSVPPFYYKFTFDEIKSYYFDLAKAVDIPVIIYNIPAFSGVSFTAGNICEFLNDERFLGVKFTSNDFYSLERIRRTHPDKILYNGYDEMMLAGLSMGADGGIGSTYNFMAEKFIKLLELFNSGNMSEARMLQAHINDIIETLIKTGVMQGEKYVLDRLGFNMGPCRRPYAELSEEQKDYIDKNVIPLL